ncbi:MAG: hypothetical protein V3T31_02010, partial [candidate division Zixibacteria bacterium]
LGVTLEGANLEGANLEGAHLLETKDYMRIVLYFKITRLVMSSTGDHDDTDMKPLWLRFGDAAPSKNVAISLSLIDSLTALIRVFHRESSEIPVYVSALSESQWGEKEKQELEARLNKVFADPVAALLPEERRRCPDRSWRFVGYSLYS